MSALVLATGFEPFEEHARNPSGDVALGLAAAPPRGVEVVSAVLPVSFQRVAGALEGALAGLGDRRPDLILALGVHPRPGWRLEGRARLRLTRRGRPDNDGVDAADATALLPAGPAVRFSPLDVGALVLSLQELAPEPASLSWDAGGYVCECAYGHTLRLAAALGTDGLFVHVPPARFTSVSVQIERIRALVLEALRQTRRASL